MNLSFSPFDAIEKASDAHAGRQPPNGFVADSDLAHLKARRGEITELMQGGMGFVQPKDKPTAGLDEESVRQPCDAAFSISNPAAIAIWWSQSICLWLSQTAGPTVSHSAACVSG